MDEEKTIQEGQPVAGNTSRKDVSEDDNRAAGRRRSVVLAGILSLLAWVALIWAPVGSIIAAVMSLALAVYGIIGSKGAMRNWAVTVIIASAVLLVVFMAFYIVLGLIG